MSANGFLSQPHQFWLEVEVPLIAIIKTKKCRRTEEGAVMAVELPLVLTGNAHPKMAQQNRRKALLHLNPALKSLAKEENTLIKAAPLMFGVEFAKDASTD